MTDFVKASAEFNKKRAKLLMPQLEELAADLLNEDDEELRDQLLETLHMPAQKEWTKNIKWLVTESTLKGSTRAAKEIDQLMKKFSEGTLSFTNILPTQALDYIDTYSPMIASITDDTTKAAIKRQFKESLSEGQSIRQIMGNLENTVGLQFSNQRLENIARTESIKFYNAGRVQKYTDPDLDDFVQAMQYDAITDARTTDICNSLDGKIVSINDRAAIARFTPPNHFQCRAVWLPISKYEDVDIDWDPNNQYQPQNGFDTTPDLFGGKAAAVKQVPKKDPTKMSIAQVRKLTDEDWDNLEDEVFRANLRKVKDTERRVDLSIRRAQKIFNERAGITGAEKVVPNIRIAHTRFGFSYIVDHKHHTVAIHNDDKFALEVSKVFEKGIKEGKIDISGIQGKYGGFKDLSTIEEAAEEVQRLLAGVDKGLDYGFMTPMVGADPKPIFDKMKLRQLNKGAVSPETVKARTKEIKQARKEAEQWIADNFDESIFTKDFRKRELIIDYNSNRSNAGRASINMAGGRRIESRVLVHEYMHTMTFNNQPAEDAAQEFFKRRTKGLKIDKINAHGEVGIKDGFYNPYVGRVYEFDKNDPKGYEVMSMGAEAMFADPEMFMLQDPDHFWFTYAVMNGLF